MDMWAAEPNPPQSWHRIYTLVNLAKTDDAEKQHAIWLVSTSTAYLALLMQAIKKRLHGSERKKLQCFCQMELQITLHSGTRVE